MGNIIPNLISNKFETLTITLTSSTISINNQEIKPINIQFNNNEILYCQENK